MNPEVNPNLLMVSSSPHAHSGASVRRIMLDVLIALTPAFAAACWFFRLNALRLTATCVLTCLATEWVCRKLMKRENSLGDLSAAVTGVLLAFNLPPELPTWMAVAGSVFAIAIAKQVFGGLGYNPFNPALAGRVDLRYETLDYLSKGYSYGYKYRTSQDFSRLASGVYVQDEWFITDDLSLTLGARTERFHSHWDPKQSGRSNWDDHERAYEAALNYRPSEWSKLYLRGTRFYRAPFCDELNYAPKALDPETGYSAEFGASAQPAEEWLADVSLWTMWMKHELFYDPGIYYNWWWGANVNSPARTRRIGLDAMLRWAREKVASAALCYRYADSRFTEGEYDSNHTPLAPHHLIRLQGEVWATDWVALFAGVREVSSQYLAGDYGNDYPKLKPYALFDCGVRFYPFGDKLDDNLMVQFAVDNLTNRKYCDFAGASGGDTYYYPAEGRFYALSARYEF